ncbi:MAG: tetratricopeptide repeat protein [Actinobacteria bacterium]|nr:tetratricopeptide repeat protein [Actinomycetota bacterium]
MKTHFFLLSIFSVQLFISSASVNAQTNYFTPQHILQFAEYLYSEGDYLRAAGEYQRFLLISESAPDDSILFKIGTCYSLGQKPQKAIDIFKKIINQKQASTLRDSALYEIAFLYFKMGKFEQSLNFLDDHPHTSILNFNKFSSLKSINYLHLKKWEKAYQISSNAITGNALSDSLNFLLRNLALEGSDIHRKNKLSAALLSSVIPGAGKMYAHRFNDGIYSLITIGLTGWQAYDGFNKNKIRSTKGWIYGILCGGFYLGDIYGSVVAVKLYNEKTENDLIKKIDIRLDLHL